MLFQLMEVLIFTMSDRSDVGEGGCSASGLIWHEEGPVALGGGRTCVEEHVRRRRWKGGGRR